MSALLEGLFIRERLAREMSAMTLVMITLQKTAVIMDTALIIDHATIKEPLEFIGQLARNNRSGVELAVKIS